MSSSSRRHSYLQAWLVFLISWLLAGTSPGQRRGIPPKPLSIPESIEALSRPNEEIRVPSGNVVGYERYHTWRMAMQTLEAALKGNAPDTRAPLEKMLASEVRDTRVNAMTVLLNDDREHLEPLRDKILAMSDDSSGAIRHAALPLLAKVKREGDDAIAIKGLEHQIESAEKDRSGIWDYVRLLCTAPVSESKAMPILLRLQEACSSSDDITGLFVTSSKRVAVSDAFREQLFERQWQILRSTASISVGERVVDAMADDDARTLPYLRRYKEFGNDKIRSCVASELVRHTGFDPRKEPEHLRAIFDDKSQQVRDWALASLWRREDLPGKCRLGVMLKEISGTKSEKWKQSVVGAVLEFMYYRHAPEERDALLTDRELGLADQMLVALADETMANSVAAGTSHISYGKVRYDEPEKARKDAKAWWEKVRAGTVP